MGHQKRAALDITPMVKLEGGLELRLRGLVKLYRLVKRQLGNPMRSSWSERLQAWSRGFTPRALRLYRLDHERSWNDNLSELFNALHGMLPNGIYGQAISNKLIFSKQLAAHGVPQPRVFGLVQRGRVIDLRGRSLGGNLQTLEPWLDGVKGLVFRPTWSGAGQGIFFLRRCDEAWRLNEHLIEPRALEQLLAGLTDFMVTEQVVQAAYAQRIFPRTTNTLRVLTLWTDAGPYVAALAHRFGTAASSPLDNWHQGDGGLSASVDAKTCRLGPAVRLERQQPYWYQVHPDSGARISGVRVPRLREVLAGLVEAARQLPYAPCIGWDVVITETGYQVLEGNAPPGTKVWQVHRPLLADARNRSFFARYGMARPL